MGCKQESRDRGAVRTAPALRKAGIAALMAGITLLGGGNAAAVDIAPYPLYAGTAVPGNLVLVPSVEFPTIISQANLGDYEGSRAYSGYFDSTKCYQYIYTLQESGRHFAPVSHAGADHSCTVNQKHWSGNYLNWAATQTIDPFRSALTGGYRVKDTPTETWLEKARHDRDSLFPDRTLATPANYTPVSNTNGWEKFSIRIAGLGNKMYFSRDGNLRTTPPIPYDPGNANHALVTKETCVSDKCKGNNVVTVPSDANVVYEVSMRVKVCVEGLLEANCKPYSQGWKPEGLIQKYSTQLRYSIFGYLNDSDEDRDGGILRANQKYVGPQTHDPLDGPLTNPQMEWDPVTGVLFANPDAPAEETVEVAVSNSGVINYLNKFGQMTDRQHKSLDPVSELFYAAIRYFKNQGNVPEYSDLAGVDDSSEVADEFPVITSWDDPIQYRCQVNTALGIGDIYSHRDRNLPGAVGKTGEPGSVPAAVEADETINVESALLKIAEMEGRSAIADSPFTGRHNSAYIAALAYDAHTRDLRPDDVEKPQTRGKQTLSTHWVDVRENQRLEPWYRNQYWLAAKYGGFRVPPDFDPYHDDTGPLQDAWWNASGDELTSNHEGNYTFKRPDNFYVASEADKMVESLTMAFRSIASESVGSGASLAANTTRLETGSMAYQARYYSGSWRGELSAYPLDPQTGAFATTAAWNAGDNVPAWNERKIYVHNPEGNGNKRYAELSWEALGASQKGVLGSEDLVNYLRGDRSLEGSEFRVRQGVLGDMVHSQPVYVGAPQMSLYLGSGFTGAEKYPEFAEQQAAREGMVYIGANDGMLHGFDEEGVERYAFMPAASIHEGLESYAQPGYSHQYFVDGEITVADVYIKNSWRSVLVGTMGRGGRAVYALDVTDPDNVEFLWEVDHEEVPELGYTFGKPIIAQVSDGEWKVLLGNGPNSQGGTARLVVFDVSDGDADVISTGVGSDNGLSAVDAWDTDRDGFYETIYGGDLKGNLWRFDYSAGNASVLFTARSSVGEAQPITAAPLILMDPQTRKVWVFFGTGRYLGVADQSDKRVQTWYAITDDGSLVGGRGELSQSSILAEVAGADGLMLRATSKHGAADLATKRGWYLDLVSPVGGAEGERMVVPNRFERGMIIGTTRVPDVSDICSPGGRGYIMALDPFTGSRPGSSFFDTDGDGDFDESDMIEVDGQKVPVSGMGFAAAPNAPIFVGSSMLVNLEDGTKVKRETRGAGLTARRESWREIIGD